MFVFDHSPLSQRIKRAPWVPSITCIIAAHFVVVSMTVVVVSMTGCDSKPRETNQKNNVDSTEPSPAPTITPPSSPQSGAAAAKDQSINEVDANSAAPADFEPFQQLWMVEADFVSVGDLAFAPDQTTFVTGGNTPRLWRLGSELPTHELEELYPLTGTIVEASTVAFASDGSFFALGAGDGTVLLIDRATMETKRRFDPHPKGVVSIALSDDDSRLVTSGYDGKIKVFDVDSGNKLAVLDAQEDKAVTADISADGKWIASGGDDALLWEAETGKRIGTLDLGEPRAISVWAIEFSPNGELIATGEATPDFENAALLWSTKDRRLQATLKHEFGVMTLAFSPDGSLLATGDANAVARIWRLADRKLVQTISLDEMNSVDGLTWLADGKALAILSEGTIRIWGTEGSVPLAKATDNVGSADSDQ